MRTPQYETTEGGRKVLENYEINVHNVVVDVKIEWLPNKSVPKYIVNITNISDTTKVILEKIREEFINKINLQDVGGLKRNEEEEDIREKFKQEISNLIDKYFPNTDEQTANMLINYLLEENLGLGKLEILLRDDGLEELVVNNHKDPVWVYHREHGWLETNIRIASEDRIRHFATMIGRNVGKEITNLKPVMDAHLEEGDRVNATLEPISSRGNTITIRKFAKDPWTITKYLKRGTISLDAAALLWLAVQNELSVLIAGGTASGKTSMLNVMANFFPPNQRIISIEDTRELTLPENLHWVPMETRLPNPEGKGGVSMLDLVVNSLRMRPDRICVGEVRKKKQAQVMLEAMHTGHSVYSTLHANNADEVITRLTNPPIDLPKPLISAMSLVLVMNRNRRTGERRVLQMAEILPNGDPKVLMRLNAQEDEIVKVNESETMMEKIRLYTGMNEEQISFDLMQKKKILKWMLNKDIEDVHRIGEVMSDYYLGSLKLD